MSAGQILLERLPNGSLAIRDGESRLRAIAAASKNGLVTVIVASPQPVTLTVITMTPDCASSIIAEHHRNRPTR